MKKNKKEFNNPLIAIVFVLAIIAVVTGATIAYWTWSSNTNERTTVNLTVPSGSSLLTASIDGGTVNVSKLAPVSLCTNSSYAIKVPVVVNYTNRTSTSATVSGTLTVSNFTAPHGTPSATDLGHLHYALTTSNSSCETGSITSGTFANKTNGALFTTTLQNNIATGVTNGSKTMYLYIWIDSGYVFQNVGNEALSDPMEDLSFKLTWSGQIVNQ